MPFTLTQDIANQDYTVRMTHRDFMGEETRKVSKIRNVGSELEAFLNAYLLVSDAGMNASDVSATLDASLALAPDSNPVQSQWSAVYHYVVLTFRRVDPVNASKNIKKEFVLISPVETAIDAPTGALQITQGVAFGAAANTAERIGAMVDFLENSLVFTDGAGATQAGGFTFDPLSSGLISVPRVLEGNPRT